MVRRLTLDQEILGSSPSPATIFITARSSSGLGCRILSPVTGVRVPYGLPLNYSPEQKKHFILTVKGGWAMLAS